MSSVFHQRIEEDKVGSTIWTKSGTACNAQYEVSVLITTLATATPPNLTCVAMQQRIAD